MSRLIVLSLIAALIAPAPAHATQSASSANGATISIAKTQLSREMKVKVAGKGFDETVGIYLAYCVLPKKGGVPSPCGGGVNKEGVGQSSQWISSNPPPYGVGLAIPYLAGGRFNEMVAVTRKIGKFDCRKIKCAITVRSDHLHEGDRTHDIYLPITIK